MLTHSGFAYYQSGPQTACLFQTRPLPLEVHILIHLCLSTSGEHRESLHFYEFFQEPGHWHKGFSFFPSFLESLSYWRWCGIFSPFLSPDHVCLSSFFLPVSQCSSSCQFASPYAGFFFFFLETSSSLCLSGDVSDHGCENKGHHFLSFCDELLLSDWSSLWNSQRDGESGKQTHQPSTATDLCEPSTALICSGRSVAFREARNGKTLTVLEKSKRGFQSQSININLSFRSCTCMKRSARYLSHGLVWHSFWGQKSVRGPLNPGRNTDPRSGAGE